MISDFHSAIVVSQSTLSNGSDEYFSNEEIPASPQPVIEQPAAAGSESEGKQ